MQSAGTPRSCATSGRSREAWQQTGPRTRTGHITNSWQEASGARGRALTDVAFLLVLALALLRSAGTAERNAERRLQARPRIARLSSAGASAVTTAVMVAALPLAGAPSVSPTPTRELPRRRRAPGARPTRPCASSTRERRARGLAPLSANATPRCARRGATPPTWCAAATSRMSRRAAARSPTACGASATCAPLRLVGRRDARVGHRRAGHAGVARPRRGCTARRTARSCSAAAIREAGIGVVRGSPGNAGAGATYVGEFGRRRC